MWKGLELRPWQVGYVGHYCMEMFLAQTTNIVERVCKICKWQYEYLTNRGFSGISQDKRYVQV
jgi:hypothetical protein